MLLHLLDDLDLYGDFLAESILLWVLQGEHDFVAVGQGTSSQIVAIKMARMSSGALCNLHVLEEVDLTEPAELASKALANYKTPSSLGAK